MNRQIVSAAAVILGAGILWGLVSSRSAKADAPPGRYTIGSGTVYDTQTKLTWEQPISPSNFMWADAQTYCSGLTLDGDDWRLPSLRELQTLVDESRSSPAIDETAFPNTSSTAFWSSSPLAGGSTNAWSVHFGIGDTGYSGVTEWYLVRCVR